MKQCGCNVVGGCDECRFKAGLPPIEHAATEACVKIVGKGVGKLPVKVLSNDAANATGAMAAAWFGTEAPAAVEAVFGKTLSLRDAQRIVAHVRYRPESWQCIVAVTPEGRMYLQWQMDQPCTKTEDPQRWHGRKWMLSPHMTKSEVVQTAFKAVLTAEEHEARERFKYKGRPIFGPHYDVDKLWEMALDSNEEVRK